MVHFTTTVLASLLASTALAAPKMLHNRHHHHHHHPSGLTGTGGSAPTDTGPYGMANATAIGPTGTGTAPVAIITMTVVPVAPTSTPAASSIAPDAGNPAHEQAVHQDACGVVHTVTKQDVVTVTVQAANMEPTTTSTLYSTTTVVNTVIAASSANSTVAAAVALTASTSSTASSLTKASTTSSSTTTSIAGAAKVLVQQSSSSSVTTVAAAVNDVKTHPAASISSPAPTTHVAVAPVGNPAPINNLPASQPAPAAQGGYASPANAVPAPASNPVPATPATPATPASGNSKRGLVYNTASLCAPLAAETGKVSWGYNWGDSSAGLSSSLSFVPMLWGGDANHVSNFATAAKVAIGGGATAIMAFNEPDMIRAYGGSQLDPSTAASTFLTYVQPHGSASVRLGTPAVTNANQQSPPMGLPWLCQFAAACKGCSLDFVTLHWYGWAAGTAQQQADAFKTYITNAKAQLPSCVGAAKPIWITEFAALPLQDQAVNAEFLSLVLPFLDAEPAVERYSFFMVSEGSLVGGGALSQAGKAYIA